MTSTKDQETYRGPTGWARWGGFGGIPWLLANFASIGWMFDTKDARTDTALGVGGLALLAGVVLSALLSHVGVTRDRAWIVAAGGGFLNGASFGPALYYLGNSLLVSTAVGILLAVLGTGALGGLQYGWINQGGRDASRERRRSRRDGQQHRR